MLGRAPQPLDGRSPRSSDAREVYALRIFKPPRRPHATWSSLRRVARGLDGHFDVYVGDQSFEVSEGGCVFMPRGRPHALAPQRRLENASVSGPRTKREQFLDRLRRSWHSCSRWRWVRAAQNSLIRFSSMKSTSYRNATSQITVNILIPLRFSAYG